MPEKIYGNTNSIRKALLDYLESFVGNVYGPGEFLPGEILDMLVTATASAGVEFAVFMDRRNRVEAISVGNPESVTLEGFEDARRGEKRLSGIRLWHTHPNGTSTPSDVDISSMQVSRLDACGVVGVNCEEERATGLTVTLPRRDEEGLFTEHETVGPVPVWRTGEFDSLFDEILEIDGEAADFASESVKNERERAIVCGVILPKDEFLRGSDAPLAELIELADTAGADTVAEYPQRRPSPDARYYIGKGLAQEISLKRQALNATLLIADDELSAGTVRNLEELTGMRVVDRTTLILDIFAARAKSREGRLQVELAQQKYRLPRLIGLGTSLSRLGGGIGTRGPGESKLTSDRNHIRRRIAYLEAELKKVAVNRGTLRKERKKNGIPQVAVVGYTNAGKSTIVNKLCDSDVFAEDMLFATLDPSVRKLVTPENRDFLLIDTVGFIRKLPHELVEAFKSTLEELKYADLLLHVIDGSSPYAEEQAKVVNDLISELGAGSKPMYVAVNKIDKAGSAEIAADNAGQTAHKTFYVSAVTGEGMDELRDAIVGFFKVSEKIFDAVIPYTQGWALSYLHSNGQIEEEEYRGDGVRVKGKIDDTMWKKELEAFLVEAGRGAENIDGTEE
ncbi:MAG: GTPase HflX [Clostridia bacterium]|nr:GTPase HflX [Clostridia bacterium]